MCFFFHWQSLIGMYRKSLGDWLSVRRQGIPLSPSAEPRDQWLFQRQGRAPARVRMMTMWDQQHRNIQSSNNNMRQQLINYMNQHSAREQRQVECKTSRGWVIPIFTCSSFSCLNGYEALRTQKLIQFSKFRNQNLIQYQHKNHLQSKLGYTCLRFNLIVPQNL